MMARRFFLPVFMSLVASAMLAAFPPAIAKDIVCAAGDVSVQDDREEGGNLCVSQAEWEKATAICAKHTEKNAEIEPLSCICQDGDRVAACGD
jgi:hypothetical protein